MIKQRLGVGHGNSSEEDGREPASETAARQRQADALLEYVRERVPCDTEGVRVTSNPLILSMVISIFELRGEGGMPRTVWELYELASRTMLSRAEHKERGHRGDAAATTCDASGDDATAARVLARGGADGCAVA